MVLKLFKASRFVSVFEGSYFSSFPFSILGVEGKG